MSRAIYEVRHPGATPGCFVGSEAGNVKAVNPA